MVTDGTIRLMVTYLLTYPHYRYAIPSKNEKHNIYACSFLDLMSWNFNPSGLSWWKSARMIILWNFRQIHLAIGCLKKIWKLFKIIWMWPALKIPHYWSNWSSVASFVAFTFNIIMVVAYHRKNHLFETSFTCPRYYLFSFW